jgi:hypothetical protein
VPPLLSGGTDKIVKEPKKLKTKYGELKKIPIFDCQLYFDFGTYQN